MVLGKLCRVCETPYGLHSLDGLAECIESMFDPAVFDECTEVAVDAEHVEHLADVAAMLRPGTHVVVDGEFRP